MASHDERLQAIRAAFARENSVLASKVEQLDDRTATLAPQDAWSAAQIAWHVALTTELLSGALSGANASMLVPRPEGFQEVLATLQLPAKMKTFPMLEPPADPTRAESVSRLRASQDTFATALQAVTPNRCATQCVQLPLPPGAGRAFGVFSLYEIGEFAVAHVVRHTGQVERTVAAV